MDNNEIKKYIVKITYKDNDTDKNYGGSGVIIPLSTTQEYFYIFTAKHTFFNENIKIEDRDILNIENTITIENPNIGKIKVTREDIQSDIDKKYDLLIFRISVKSNLKPLSIFSDDFRDCTVMGYPKARTNKDTKYDAFACTYKQQNEKPYIFEIDSNKGLANYRDKDLNANSTMQGVSGSGVFVKGSTEELYLVGIQIQSAPHNALIAIDLREIFDELNKKLDNSLTLGGYQFFEEIGLDIRKLEFDSLLDKLNNDDEILKIKKHNDFDSEIDFLEQPNYRNSMSTKYKKLQGDMKKLSDTYLYQGIIFHKDGKNQQATNRFKKAITLYPEYKHYFAKAKYERDNITKKQKEAKEKIDKDSSFSNDINLVIDTLKSDINSYEKDKKYEDLEESYRQIISLLSIEFDKNENEIKDLSKKFSKTLIFNEKLEESENILLKIKDNEVGFDLYKIYTNDEFSKNLNKKQFSNKLIDLLGRLDRESSEYEDIKNRLEELNIFDNKMIEFHEKFLSLENKYENTIEKLTQDIQLLSTHISDKTLLNQINYRVFNADKKLETVSISLSKKIDTSANSINKKLDEIAIKIKKTNNQKLDIFLENIYRSNRALVSKIQTMYHQNDRVNRKVKIALNSSIKQINEDITKLLDRPISNSQEIKEIIKDSNWNFYNAIQGLYEKESDSYNRKLLEMSIAFTKKEHELHVENLEKSYEVVISKIKSESILKKDKLEQSIKEKNYEINILNKWIESLDIKYQNLKINSSEVEEKLAELDKMKDSISLMEHRSKIEELEKLIERLKGKNEQVEELKKSIDVSKKTTKELINLKNECKKEIDNKDNLQLKIFSKVKNIEEVSNKILLELRDRSKELNRRFDEVNINIKRITSLFDEHLEHIKEELADINKNISLNDNNFKNIKKKLDNLSVKIDEIEGYALEETLRDSNKILIKNIEGGKVERKSNKLLFIWLFSSLAVILTISFFIINPPKYLIENSWSKLVMDLRELF